MKVKMVLRKTLSSKDIFDKIRKEFTDVEAILKKYGERGVSALEEATPKDTGLTSKSWRYEINKTKSGVKLSWHNNNIQNGLNIAILIQYGHVTPSGYRIEGKDYINPVMQPIFDDIISEIWKEGK